MFPSLLAEVAKSTTVVYDASSYALPDDAVEALLAGSATATALTDHYGYYYGRAKLHWALVIALIEAHQDKAQPTRTPRRRTRHRITRSCTELRRFAQF